MGCGVPTEGRDTGICGAVFIGGLDADVPAAMPALVAIVHAACASWMPVKSFRNSITVACRSSRFFARARMMAAFLRGGSEAPPGYVSIGVGGAVRCLVAHSHGVRASNGR